MNLTAEAKLKFDRRMQGRPGFVTQEELDIELERLEDASAKALGPDEDPQPTLKPAAKSAAQAEAPAAAAPTPGISSDTPATFGTRSFGGDPDDTL